MKPNRLGMSVAVSAILCACCVAAANASDEDWQMERLFNPTPAELQHEANGSVFIYDGMKDKIAERALDEHFDRIQAMMFVRTVVTNETAEPIRDKTSGEVIVEDDGCD